MQTITMGKLKVSTKWETFLESLPAQAEGTEGLGRMWEQDHAAYRKGLDGTIHQGWRLTVVHGVRFQITEGTQIIKVPANQSGTGKPYRLVKIGSTIVHLHDGLDFKDGIVVGNAHVCARIIWPKGAEQKEPNGLSWAWRNYILYLDLFPTIEEEVSSTLRIVDPERWIRTKAIMLGSPDSLLPQKGETSDPIEVTVWATKSANCVPARSGNPSTGTDQLILFVPEK